MRVTLSFYIKEDQSHVHEAPSSSSLGPAAMQLQDSTNTIGGEETKAKAEANGKEKEKEKEEKGLGDKDADANAGPKPGGQLCCVVVLFPWSIKIVCAALCCRVGV